MNKREAKRWVCARAAIALADELDGDVLGAGSDIRISDDDYGRIMSALGALVDELTNRAGLPPRRRPEVPGQASLFDLVEELGLSMEELLDMDPSDYARPVDTIDTSVL